MSVNIPTCPTDCTSQVPIVSFNDCAPETHWGQINKIYLTNIGQSFDDLGQDYTTSPAWLSRINNSGVNVDAIRELTVIGNLPAAETQEKEISNRRKIYSPKKYSLAFKIDETNDINYEWLRGLGCNGQYLMWFANDTHIYGGDTGIEVSIDAGLIIPENYQDLDEIQGTFKWESQFYPERTINPLI